MTLSPLDDAKRLHTLPFQGRGRGWGLSAGRLDQLVSRAADMRCNPTEPEKRLWRRLSNAQLGGYKFRRQALIGPYIADFACPSVGLIVELDGNTHIDPEADARRDDKLASHGYHVIRVTNDEVMRDLDGVLGMILDILRRMSLRRAPHPNPSPEGEGLS